MYSKFNKIIENTGLLFFVRISKIISGEERRLQLKLIVKSIAYPLVAIAFFLSIWSFFAGRINTSLGKIPSPQNVWQAATVLWQEYKTEKNMETDFNRAQLIEKKEAYLKDPKALFQVKVFVHPPTFIDQICTSLKTVFTGFLFASIIGVPLGLLCGLSRGLMLALNPLIQIFKPISPLAWLPIVTIVISSIYVSNDGFFQKSFIISVITVSLCSIWPSLINTAAGVEGISQDYLNLAKVFKLNTTKKIFKIIIPASMPYIFAGLRISLGIGWMVLIATEMLAQNPGLGKFIWDEFQNGGSNSLSKIVVAVLTIGIIGFILDRILLLFQSLFGFSIKKY